MKQAKNREMRLIITLRINICSIRNYCHSRKRCNLKRENMLHPETHSVLLREIRGLPSTVVTTKLSMMEGQSEAIDLEGEDRHTIKQTIKEATKNGRTDERQFYNNRQRREMVHEAPQKKKKKEIQKPPSVPDTGPIIRTEM